MSNLDSETEAEVGASERTRGGLSSPTDLTEMGPVQQPASVRERA